VLCIDEKTPIQAIDRHPAPVLPLSPDRQGATRSNMIPSDEMTKPVLTGPLGDARVS